MPVKTIFCPAYVLYAMSLVFLLLVSLPCAAKQEKPHSKITRQELVQIIDRHQEWLKKYDVGKRTTSKAKRDFRRTNLNLVDLSKANLSGKDLTRAKLTVVNLKKADIAYTNLTRAVLYGSNLSQAKMTHANLSHANLNGTTLKRASLSNAIMDHAYLNNADLTGAVMFRVDMRNASLIRVKLTGSWMSGADLAGAIFEPESLPLIDSIAYAKNLHKMTYRTNPQMLFELRIAFSEAGYREQERAMTHAINQSGLWRDESISGITESWFKYIFLGLPTQWGMYPGRALRILLAGVFLFMVFYMVALQTPETNAGIWRIRGEKRLLDKEEKDEELIQPNGFLSVVVMAFYFSLLSAFNIGWRDLNVGSWIHRIQFKEYTLRATGWVRTVSGIQSLISVYLVAMWVLTYFGRPFG